jgi:hypothetical protein
MSLYLNPKLVELSFKRLAPSSNAGKRPLERTSALMYFLAFDAAVKNVGCCPLDLNPNSLEGRNNRQFVELEYLKLVKLKSSTDRQVRHVVVLGKIDKGGTAPEKRISSNFFTVPVKKASESVKVYNYPNRPSPLLKMGSAATQIKWGVNYHNDWKLSFPNFLGDLKGNTPFTDLAVFVSRNDHLPDNSEKLHEALASVIQERFSEDLATFWARRMDAEKIFFKHGDDPFRSSYSDPLAEDSLSMEKLGGNKESLKTLDRQILIDRIVYLEGLLDAQEIEYQSITH